MEVPWETANNNPLYLFMQDRGDIRMSQTLLDEMSVNSDPRVPFYFAENADGTDIDVSALFYDVAASKVDLFNLIPVSVLSGTEPTIVTYTGSPILAVAMESGSGNIFISEISWTPIPLPAALPLFGTGLGILGFLGWRRRRKAQAV